jgi:hypothetical protein
MKKEIGVPNIAPYVRGVRGKAKTRVIVSYETKKGYEKEFDEKIIAFFETIGGVFQGSGTGFFGETPARDLEFKISMDKIKK